MEEKLIDQEIMKLIKLEDFKKVKNHYDMFQCEKLFKLIFYEEVFDYEDILNKKINELKIIFENLAKINKNETYKIDFIEAIILYTRYLIFDELLEILNPSFKLLRQKTKNLNINNPDLAIIYKLFFGNIRNKLEKLQESKIKSICEEYKLNTKEILKNFYMINSQDISIYLEVENFYSLKFGIKNLQNLKIEKEIIQKYLIKTTELSNMILENKIDHRIIQIFPHIQNNILYNDFGFENTEILFKLIELLKSIKDYKEEKDFVYVVLENIFVVEKARFKIMKIFEAQFNMINNMQNNKEPLKEQMDEFKNMMKNNEIPIPTSEQLLEMQNLMGNDQMPMLNPDQLNEMQNMMKNGNFPFPNQEQMAAIQKMIMEGKMPNITQEMMAEMQKMMMGGQPNPEMMAEMQKVMIEGQNNPEMMAEMQKIMMGGQPNQEVMSTGQISDTNKLDTESKKSNLKDINLISESDSLFPDYHNKEKSTKKETVKKPNQKMSPKELEEYFKNLEGNPVDDLNKISENKTQDNLNKQPGKLSNEEIEKILDELDYEKMKKYIPNYGLF